MEGKPVDLVKNFYFPTLLVIFIKKNKTPAYLLNYYHLKIEYIIFCCLIYLMPVDSMELGKSIKHYQATQQGDRSRGVRQEQCQATHRFSVATGGVRLETELPRGDGAAVYYCSSFQLLSHYLPSLGTPGLFPAYLELAISHGTLTNMQYRLLKRPWHCSHIDLIAVPDCHSLCDLSQVI